MAPGAVDIQDNPLGFGLTRIGVRVKVEEILRRACALKES